MKKLVCLILAIASMCLVLVSCNEDILAQTEEALVENQYAIPEKEAVVTVDFYIITDDENPNSQANLTVSREVDDMFKDTYNTSVVMHYICADEYADTVKTTLSAQKEQGIQNKISVVLINSLELYNELMDMEVLADVSDVIDSKYPTLLKQLNKVLPYTWIPELDDDGNTQYDDYGNLIAKCYAVPNNQVYGTYTYTAINREIAIYYNLITKAEACKSAEDIEALISEFEAASAADPKYTLDAFVQKDIVGYYGDIVKAEQDNCCVITVEPQIYTYFSINKDIAKKNDLEDDAKSCNTVDDVNNLIAKFEQIICKDGKVNISDEELAVMVEEFVSLDTGYYGDMVKAQKDNYCVVSKAPSMTIEDVFSSAFAVAGDPALAERAMRVIYAVNTNSKFRNLLQYGVQNMNYTIYEENGIQYVSLPESDNATNRYKISLKYTGDVYMAYNSEDVCLLCTGDSPCTGEHIYWTHDNKATVTTYVNYDYNVDTSKNEELIGALTLPAGLTNTKFVFGEEYDIIKEVRFTQNGEWYKEIYTFAGWYTSSECVEETFVKELKPDMGVVDLYAKWEFSESVPV